MKRILICILVLFPLWILVGCRPYEEITIKFKPYKESDYTTKFLKIYEEDSILHPILDSIIAKTKECPMYNGLKHKMAFLLGVHKKKFYATEEDRRFPWMSVSVFYDPRYSGYSNTLGVFYYRNYDFYIIGSFIDLLFKETGQYVPISCIKPDKFQFEFHNRGDMDMYWWYQYIDKKFVIRQYGYCH